MISFLRGTVYAAGTDRLIVDIGPLGIEAACTPATAMSYRVGDHVELVTSLVMREDSWTVYGFIDRDEREVFELVQTVTGIGPRIALALLATLSPDEVRAAVASDDLVRLTKVPGIGRKGASRLVLELKDKLGPAQGAAPSIGNGGEGWQAAVGAGLMSLGWSAKEAEQAVAAVTPLAETSVGADGRPDVGALLKAALRSLDRS